MEWGSGEFSIKTRNGGADRYPDSEVIVKVSKELPNRAVGVVQMTHKIPCTQVHHSLTNKKTTNVIHY